MHYRLHIKLFNCKTASFYKEINPANLVTGKSQICKDL